MLDFSDQYEIWEGISSRNLDGHTIMQTIKDKSRQEQSLAYYHELVEMHDRIFRLVLHRLNSVYIVYLPKKECPPGYIVTAWRDPSLVGTSNVGLVPKKSSEEVMKIVNESMLAPAVIAIHNNNDNKARQIIWKLIEPTRS